MSSTIFCRILLSVNPLEVLKNSAFAQQVKQFSYEVFTFTVVTKKQPSLIPERHNYVIASEFMTRQQYIDSWMFSWLVLHFHHYAWTQLLARFARKYKDLSYLQFYEDLFEQCISKDPFFMDLYNKQEAELKSFFWNTSSDTVFDNDNVIVVLNQIEWHENRDKVQQIISDWARTYFSDLEDDLLEEVIHMNTLWVTNMDRHNVHEEMFDYNIPEYIVGDQELVKQPVTYTFNNKYRWPNNKDFKDKLFYKNRNGFSIQNVILPTHKDTFYTLRQEHQVELDDCYRYLIFLEDWEFGQFVGFEEALGLERWVAGDTFKFTGHEMHFAVNASAVNFHTCQVSTFA